MSRELAKQPLSELCRHLIDSNRSYRLRADSAAAAAVRLAQNMLRHEGIFSKDANGFRSNEELYGGGTASYLTNAQGLVGVLLPLVEVEWTEPPSGADHERILLAADGVLSEVHAGRRIAFLLEPYVPRGPIDAWAKKGERFFCPNGVAWALSSLVLLFAASSLGKLDLGSREPRVRDGIVVTYGLLLDAYLRDAGGAGWGWCSLSKEPDLYQTWSISQDLGDVDDYVLAPSHESLKEHPQRKGLESALRQAIKERASHNENVTLEAIYRDVARWIYHLVFSGEAVATKEDPLARMLVANAPENLIYLKLLALETLVYLKADDLLANVLGEGSSQLREKFYGYLKQCVGDLKRLRETPWYEEEQSTLKVPLAPLGTLDVRRWVVPEPCLEPLALRGLSYGPQFLEHLDVLEDVGAALSRHAKALRQDGEIDLWDEESPNFIICERTVESFIMLRKMFSELARASAASPTTSGIQLLLPAEQLELIVNAVQDRLAEVIERTVQDAVASFAPQARSGRPTAAFDPRVTDLLIAPDQNSLVRDPQKLASLLAQEPGEGQEMIAQMFGALFIRFLSAALRASEKWAKDEGPLAELAAAIAAILPKALGYYVQANATEYVFSASDFEAQRGNFDRQRVEAQFRAAVTQYVLAEFKENQPLDIANALSDTLKVMERRGAG